ncbi:OTU domain-containing protein OS=Streptomyces fumanus OX=67302 GN=GCM10018772_56770 PE=4 SV=1 [Streptomyces fumanus]
MAFTDTALAGGLERALADAQHDPHRDRRTADPRAGGPPGHGRPAPEAVSGAAGVPEAVDVAERPTAPEPSGTPETARTPETAGTPDGAAAPEHGPTAAPRAPWYIGRGMLGKSVVREVGPWSREENDRTVRALAAAVPDALARQVAAEFAGVLAVDDAEGWRELLDVGAAR